MSKSKNIEQFGANAADYVNSLPHAKGASLSRLVEIIGPKMEWQVLDIATGTGHTALTFAPFVAQVWATDITPEMLAIARQQADSRGFANVIVETADAEALPYPEESFDLATCRIAPHHFERIGLFVREAVRVLRPGGFLAVVDNIVPPGSAGDYINAFEKLRDPSHGRCLTFNEWLTLFNKARLNISHQETMSKRIVFENWAARHDTIMQRYLLGMLKECSQDVADFFQPEFYEAETTFRLQEGLIIGQRQG